MTIEQLEAASDIGTTVPLEGGHLVIVGDNIGTLVVDETVAGAVNDHTAFV